MFEHISAGSRSIPFRLVDGDSFQRKKSPCLKIGPKMVQPRKALCLADADGRPQHHVSPVPVIRIQWMRVRRPGPREAPAVQAERRPVLPEPLLQPPKGGVKRQVAENPDQSRVKRAKEPEKIE